MSRPLIRWAIAGLALLSAASAGSAQRPSAQEAEALLGARPELAAELRARLRASGLTPEQVRARLRAEGYPEHLLDAYLQSGGVGTTDSVPSASAVAALRALAIDDLDTLGGTAGSAPRAGGERVEPRASTLAITCDTLPGTTLPAASGSDSLARDLGLPAGGALPAMKCVSRDGRPVAPPDSGFTIFGLDLFSSATSQFDPNLAGPVDGSYRLGPGDRLVLLLTGEVELARQLDVTREGFIFIPQVGQLFVANLTVRELEDVLYGALGRVYPGVRRGDGATTRFSLNVARLRSLQVFVAGDVVRPGSYRISSAGTALTALYAAGGPTSNGSLRRVEIRRGGKVADVLDVYDYLLRGDASHDARLESGDVVFVPIHGASVRIVGEVNRPGTYELRSGETLADLVRAAGGFRPTAVHDRVQIERVLPAQQRRDAGSARVVLDVSLFGPRARNGDGGGASDTVHVAVEGGDVVRVFGVPAAVRNRITVTGNVWQPGTQGFEPGLTLTQALARAGGLRPDAYLGQVLVTRTLADSSRVQHRTTLRADGSAIEELLLAEDDEVRVFSVAEFRPQYQVAITGAVRKSGKVGYREGMTLRDLILLAGGLAEGAWLGEAEIARLPEDRAAGVTAKTIRVPLDSTYLFGAPGVRGGRTEVPLQPHDHVLVLRQPDWGLQRTVVLTGEVRFPGRYSLERRDERLGSLVTRAGGLMPNADSSAIMFLRSQGAVGRIGVDLPRALRDRRVVDNLVLQDGDSIHIPPYSGIVTVAGAVNAPMAVAYVRGANLDYYVRAAGGPGRTADMRRAYVSQASGKVESVQRRTMLPDAVPTPGPGSRVVVPERAAGDGSALSRNLPMIASIVGSLVTIVAVLAR